MKQISRILILIVFFTTQSCKTNSTILSTPEVAMSTPENIATVVYKNQQATIKTKQTRIITTNEAFTNLITELAIPATDYETILNIDFKKHTLIAYFMGEKPSNGFDIEVEKATILINKIELIFKEIEPKKGAMVLDVLTAPYVFIVVPKGKEITLN